MYVCMYVCQWGGQLESPVYSFVLMHGYTHTIHSDILMSKLETLAELAVWFLCVRAYTHNIHTNALTPVTLA